jgi:hypothetical protein
MIRTAILVVACCSLVIVGSAAAQRPAGPPKPGSLESDVELMRQQLSRMTLDANQQQGNAARIAALESTLRAREIEIGLLRSQVGHVGQKAPMGLVMTLYAGFCALWASNSGRSATKWFFLGLLFSVFAMGFLLYYNKQDRDQAATSPTT